MYKLFFHKKPNIIRKMTKKIDFSFLLLLSKSSRETRSLYGAFFMTYAYAVWLCSPFKATVMQQHRQNSEISGHKSQGPPTHSYAEGIRRSSVKYIIRIYTYPSIKQKKIRVRRSSVGCGVAQSGCGVAQLVVRQLAVR